MTFMFDYFDRIDFYTHFISRATGHRCVGVVDDFGNIVVLF